jgi:hypothetical protein
VKGSIEVTGSAGWIIRVNIVLDIGIHGVCEMMIWRMVMEEQKKTSVHPLLWMHRSRKGEGTDQHDTETILVGR